MVYCYATVRPGKNNAVSTTQYEKVKSQIVFKGGKNSQNVWKKLTTSKTLHGRKHSQK